MNQEDSKNKSRILTEEIGRESLKETDMQKGFLTVAVVVFAIGSIGWAEVGGIGVDIDATWVSKYIWRGFDLLDDKAAFQPSIILDFGSGFSAGVWASYAGSSKGGGSLSTVDATEFDYFLTYSGSAFTGEAYQMDYAVSWLYYDYIDQPSSAADAYEINVATAFPQLCPFGIVPRYTAIYLWPAESRGASNGLVGWMHQFGIDYDIVLGEVIPNNPEQVITFSADILYNDGAGLAGTTNGGATPTDVDHDWSHIVWGLTTEIAAPFGGTFRPGVYYQTSMEDTVNTEDEFWTGLSYTLGF